MPFAGIHSKDQQVRNVDRHLIVHSRLFLPLYQKLGDDAYFLVRPVRTVWLAVSRFLRRLGAARVLPMLPGVHRAKERTDTYLVNRRVARWLVVQLFHLLGYRRVKGTARVVVFRGQGVRE